MLNSALVFDYFLFLDLQNDLVHVRVLLLHGQVERLDFLEDVPEDVVRGEGELLLKLGVEN